MQGITQMKLGPKSSTVHNYPETPDDPEQGNYDIHPVYALRFKGTSQYAAYRWEVKPIDANPLECYLSIKIKALYPQDNATTIEDVSTETFWNDGFVEFKFPASGYYMEKPDGVDDNILTRGVGGYCMSASKWDKEPESLYHMGFDLRNAYIPHDPVNIYLPMRFVNVLN